MYKFINRKIKQHIKLFARMFKYFYFYFIIKLEITKINKIKDLNKYNINLIYDMSISPLTIGDAILFIMIGRFFLAKNKKINFYLILETYKNNDLEYFKSNIDASNQVISTIISITKELLKDKNSNIILCDWKKFERHNARAGDNKYILFEDFVLKRKPIYKFSFNLLNFLMSNENNEIVKKTLLSNSFKHKKPNNLKFDFSKKFITYSLRYNLYYGNNRNDSDKAFLEITKILKKTFPKHSLVIISDENTKIYFNKLAQKNNMKNIYFCKSETNSFIEDCMFILNSDFHFQVNGGASSIVAMMSCTPYLIMGEPNHEFFFEGNKMTCWQNNKQHFQKINIDVQLPVIKNSLINKFKKENVL